MATPTGSSNSASVAGPPSPEKPRLGNPASVSVPATTVRMPEESTLRTRWTGESEM